MQLMTPDLGYIHHFVKKNIILKKKKKAAFKKEHSLVKSMMKLDVSALGIKFSSIRQLLKHHASLPQIINADNTAVLSDE